MHFDINAKKMIALNTESVYKMINELPDEILNMTINEFQERMDAGDETIKAYGDKQFEFSDSYGLVTQAPIVNAESVNEADGGVDGDGQEANV